MGLGMGGTMMPIMTSALRTLTNHEVARGSTLVNIVQQVGGSIGTAVMSVILTNAASIGDVRLSPASHSACDFAARGGFATTFMVAFVLVLLALIPVVLPASQEGGVAPARRRGRRRAAAGHDALTHRSTT